MHYNDVLVKLAYLIKRNNISQTEIGEVIGVERRAMNGRADRNSKFKPAEIEKLEEHFDIKFKDVYISSNTWEQVNNEKILENSQFVGHRLAEVQEELGYLDRGMAKLMGIDEKRYMRIKLGQEDATVSELAALAGKVDVSLDWLIKG